MLVLAHVRELSQQIADVYQALTKNTDIQVSNYTNTGKSENCQVLVSTIGKIQGDLKGRGKSKLDFTHLKCIVIDEADFFFKGNDEVVSMKNIDTNIVKKLPQKVQYILFSATYPEDVKEAIA